MYLSDHTRLQHIILEMERAISLMKNKTEDDLMNDFILDHALMRCLEIIGEATSKISPECKALYPQVAWKEMKELRNRVIHHYEGLIYEIIVDVVRTKLPVQLAEIKKIDLGNDTAGKGGNTTQ